MKALVLFSTFLGKTCYYIHIVAILWGFERWLLTFFAFIPIIIHHICYVRMRKKNKVKTIWVTSLVLFVLTLIVLGLWFVKDSYGYPLIDFIEPTRTALLIALIIGVIYYLPFILDKNILNKLGILEGNDSSMY